MQLNDLKHNTKVLTIEPVNLVIELTWVLISRPIVFVKTRRFSQKGKRIVQ